MQGELRNLSLVLRSRHTTRKEKSPIHLASNQRLSCSASVYNYACERLNFRIVIIRLCFSRFDTRCFEPVLSVIKLRVDLTAYLAFFMPGQFPSLIPHLVKHFRGERYLLWCRIARKECGKCYAVNI